jgi:cytochrome c-type biogenesis protein CcmF
MIPEIGHFALILALSLAVIQGVLPMIGAHRNNEAMMSVARPAAFGQFFFVAVSFACLIYAFVIQGFSRLECARGLAADVDPDSGSLDIGRCQV